MKFYEKKVGLAGAILVALGATITAVQAETRSDALLEQLAINELTTVYEVKKINAQNSTRFLSAQEILQELPEASSDTLRTLRADQGRLAAEWRSSSEGRILGTMFGKGSPKRRLPLIESQIDTNSIFPTRTGELLEVSPSGSHYCGYIVKMTR